MGVPLTLDLTYPCPASRNREASDDCFDTGPHWSRFHGGNDIPPSRPGLEGEPVYPMWRGRVVFAEPAGSHQPGTWGSAYGNRILVRHKMWHRHANGTVHRHDWFTFYAHLETMRPKAGWKAKTDRMLGTLGDTGNTFGPHVHFAIQLDRGWLVGVVDPHPYLEKARNR